MSRTIIQPIGFVLSFFLQANFLFHPLILVREILIFRILLREMKKCLSSDIFHIQSKFFLKYIKHKYCPYFYINWYLLSLYVFRIARFVLQSWIFFFREPLYICTQFTVIAIVCDLKTVYRYGFIISYFYFLK
jgi:hypothetical protein